MRLSDCIDIRCKTKEESDRVFDGFTKVFIENYGKMCGSGDNAFWVSTTIPRNDHVKMHQLGIVTNPLARHIGKTYGVRDVAEWSIVIDINVWIDHSISDLQKMAEEMIGAKVYLFQRIDQFRHLVEDNWPTAEFATGSEPGDRRRIGTNFR